MSQEPDPRRRRGARRACAAGSTGATGRRYWKSLEELADSPGFLEFLHREFPEQASVVRGPEGPARVPDPHGRLAGPRRPHRLHEAAGGEDRPLRAAAGGAHPRPAALLRHRGRSRRLRARRAGREPRGAAHQDRGQPRPPASLGATDVFGQAAILGLYDPDRSQTVQYYGEVRTWAALPRGAARGARQAEGQGGRRASASSPAPSPRPRSPRRWRRCFAAFPQARWHAYEPAGRDNARAGAVLAFGEAVETQLPLRPGRRDPEPRGRLRGQRARQPAPDPRVRRAAQGPATRSRQHEPALRGRELAHRPPARRPTTAWPCAASEIEGFARAVAAGLGPRRRGRDDGPRRLGRRRSSKDLQAHAGRALVIAGESAARRRSTRSPTRSTRRSARSARPSRYTAPVEARSRGPGRVAPDARRRHDGGAGRRAGRARRQPGLRRARRPAVRRGPRQGAAPRPPRPLRRRDGRALPLAHARGARPRDLERRARRRRHRLDPAAAHRSALRRDARPTRSWPAFPGRAERRATTSSASTGRTSSARPTSRSAGSARSTTASCRTPRCPRRAVAVRPGDWATARAEGGRRRAGSRSSSAPTRASSTAASRTTAGCRSCRSRSPSSPGTTRPREPEHGRERSAASRTRGRRPAATSPTSSSSSIGGRSVRAPAWILPGHPDDAVTVHLGYGRTRAGRVGTGMGFDAYALRTSDAPWFGRRARGREDRRDAPRSPAPRTTGRSRPGGAARRESGTSSAAHRSRSSRRTPDVFAEARPRSRRPSLSMYAGPQVRGPRLGHVDRPQLLRGLQRLRHRLPVREQHPGGGQGPGRPRPRDALDPRRPLLRGPAREPRRPTTSPSSACTARTPPARWSARSPPPCTATRA